MKDLRRRLPFLIVILAIFGVSALLLYSIASQKIVPQAAVSGVTLTLSPSSGNKVLNTNFDVAIVLNTNGQQSAGTDVILTYNTSDLQVIDADTTATGTQIRPGTLYASYPANTVDAAQGKIWFSGIITPGSTTGYSGTGTLATITFKVLTTSATPSPVNFVFTRDATNDSNVTSMAYTDMLYSVTNASYNLVNPDVTVNFNYSLQGRTNQSATGIILKAYPAGGTTPAYTSGALTGSSTGTGTVTISGLTPGNYDFQLKAPYWLSTKILNQNAVSPLTLTFGSQKAGDFNNDNIINSIDFSNLNTNWLSASAIADINADGIVNTIDFSYLNSNWNLQGQ